MSRTKTQKTQKPQEQPQKPQERWKSEKLPVTEVEVALNAHRLLAHNSREYGGADRPRFRRDEKYGEIVAAKCTVYRLNGGDRIAYSAEVWMDEQQSLYLHSQSDYSTLRVAPHLWLGNVAELAALQRAFPMAQQ